MGAFYPLGKDGRVKCTMTPGHLDGWGISGYCNERAVYFDRRAEPLTEGRPFFDQAVEKAERSRTPVVIANIRKASEGSRAIHNTHPFRAKDWIFAHNGTIFGAQASLPLEDFQPIGDTDSERYLLWILERIANALDPTAALVDLLKHSRDALVFSSLTFLLTNGKTLWAYRDYGNKRLDPGETVEEREKYYTLYAARVGPSSVVCSEPLTTLTKNWQPLSQRTLAVFSTLTPALQTVTI
jgi:predicted glutamine amidotransferase